MSRRAGEVGTLDPRVLDFIDAHTGAAIFQ
jgi:hypothetical protein